MCIEGTFSTAIFVQMAWGRLLLKEFFFGKRPTFTMESKPSRQVLNYGQRLEVHPMYGCILHFSAASSFGCKTREAQNMTTLNLTTLTSGPSLKYPWGVETVILVCLLAQYMVRYHIKISDENSKNLGFYCCLKLKLILSHNHRVKPNSFSGYDFYLAPSTGCCC